MIDVSKLNRIIIAQENIIELIKDILESESSTVEPLEAFGMGLYASQFQMKYSIQQAISRGETVSDYEMELLHILEVTEKNSFGDIIMFNEINQWIDDWIDKHFPHTMELTK